MTKSKWYNFAGKAYWAKVYEPDEFRGAIRWTLEFAPESDEVLQEMKKVLNENKKFKEPNETIPFPYTSISRPAFKLIKGGLVHFAPPIIYDKDRRTPLVKYQDANGEDVRSYNGEKKELTTVGEQFNIGNGSDVVINLCVYPTAMGPGSRLESISVIDLVEYNPDNNENEEGATEEAPW